MRSSEDIVIACADLAERTGATDFELGYLNDDVSTEDADWWARAQYRGAGVFVEHRRSPSEAALGLSERLLIGATCKCGKKITLSDDYPGCRWKLMGPKWESGCNSPPFTIDKDKRGDVPAMQLVAQARIREKEKGE